MTWNGAAWRPGDATLIRYVQNGVVRYAEAVIVVEDRPERLVVYAPLGAPRITNFIDWSTGAFEGAFEHPRHTTDALKILEPGAGFMVTAMYQGGGGPFMCWYIDLIDPFRRTGGGVVTWDQSLDIVAGADRRWRWKDEDHFARIQELGWITREKAEAIRRDANAAIQRLETNARPFSEPWAEWRGDAAWPLPTLPHDWDVAPD